MKFSNYNEKGLENSNFLKKYYIALVLLVLLIGCVPPKEPTTPTQPTVAPKTEPAVTSTIPTPAEPSAAEEPKEEISIPDEIKDVLEKGKTRLKSYSYNYKNPQSDLKYNIYVKGNKTKIILPEMNVKEQGKFYNTIYLDTEEKTAEAYCIGYSSCEGKVGKAKDLGYEEEYIETPLDWLEKVTQAEKIDKRQVEGRDSLYLETNIGKITLETYYGFLYLIEDGEDKWEFTDAAFNSVKDSDVTPSQ